MDMNNNTIFKYLNESERVREGSGEEERKGAEVVIPTIFPFQPLSGLYGGQVDLGE